VLRFVSFFVILLFAAIWLAGESPTALLHRFVVRWQEQANYVDAGGDRSDWGRP